MVGGKEIAAALHAAIQLIDEIEDGAGEMIGWGADLTTETPESEAPMLVIVTDDGAVFHLTIERIDP